MSPVVLPASTIEPQVLRRDTGFLVFSFPRSLGSGVYDEINGGQRKLVRTYLNYISTKFRPIWMRFGARLSKTPCQTLYPSVSVLARCIAYACTKSHPNRSKFGGDIAQINAHRFLLSPINFVINSTSQRPWEQKGQKTRVTPYVPMVEREARGEKKGAKKAGLEVGAATNGCKSNFWYDRSDISIFNVLRGNSVKVYEEAA